MQLDFLAKLSTRVAAAFAPKRTRQRISPPSRTPTDADELQTRARTLLRDLGCAALAARAEVRWNPRMRSTAGMAFSAKSLITLNPRLLDFSAADIDRTLLHELAHLLAHHRAGRRRISAHGPEWQQACADLGIPGEKRCHDLPLPRREIKRAHLYRCPTCGIEVRRVRPLKRKSACLSCCKKHSRGCYDERFRFVKLAAE